MLSVNRARLGAGKDRVTYLSALAVISELLRSPCLSPGHPARAMADGQHDARSIEDNSSRMPEPVALAVKDIYARLVAAEVPPPTAIRTCRTSEVQGFESSVDATRLNTLRVSWPNSLLCCGRVVRRFRCPDARAVPSQCRGRQIQRCRRPATAHL